MSSSRESIKKAVIEIVKSSGFDQVRVAPPDLPQKYQRAFEQWVEAGRHGEMAYLSRRIAEDRRPRTLFPEMRSVLVLAANYFHADSASPSKSSGWVSRYAVTRDYHKVIRNRLKKVSANLLNEFGAQSRYYVDTGPVLERAYAEVAGLGYIGKNTCIIGEPFGSWVFLAVVLTTLDIPPDDNGLKIHCGSCTRCIDQCPTNAILDNHTINAKKCISYLTIENRGAIPVELREQMGNWLFGCDICQEVCPHNSRAVEAQIEDFTHIRIAGRQLPLSEILAIEDDAEFLAKFAGSPIMRAKRRGIIRNACVVAGNSGDAKLLPILGKIAAGSDEMLAEHAGWAISRLTDSCG